MTGGVDASQRRAARVAGFVYLFAMATAVLGEAFARGPLIVPDAAETARNILAHERLFRLGIAGYLLHLASVVALIVALVVILEPVNRNLALFAAFMRLVETAVGVAVLVTNFDALQLLGSADDLQPLTANQLQRLARTTLGAYHDKMSVSLVFLGAGSAVFGYLWYKSGYIPKALAVLGIVGAALLVATAFAVVIDPSILAILAPFYFAPHFVFEVTIGLLLLFKPLPVGRRDLR